MKKYLLHVALLATLAGYSQGQNDKWYFGVNRGVNFTPATPSSISGGQISTNAATATISDANGNLLFYTNGNSVWNRQHQLMANGTALLGSTNTQQVVIAPYPGSTSLYYIFTMGVYTSGGNASAYSIVDMSIGATGTNGLPLGDVTAVKNVLLLDQNGNSFVNSSENAALVAHSDNKSYWLLYYNNEQLFSYRIDSGGLNPVPVVSNIPTPATFPGPYNPNARAHIRVSPTFTDRPYSNLISISRTLGSVSDNNLPRVVSFDDTTGAITNAYFWSTIPFGFTSTEFSENGNILYGISSNGSINDFDLTWVPGMPSHDRVINWGSGQNAYIQKAADGEIYASINNVSTNTFLGRITDQNNIISAGYNAQALSVGSFVNGGLPPLVPILDDTNTGCWGNLTLSIPEVGNITHQVSESIVTNSLYNVNSGATVNLKAGSFVLMMPNTTVSIGSVFTAEIDGCTPGVSRPANIVTQDPIVIFKSAEDLGLETSMIVYPNPASDVAKISLTGDVAIKNLTVYTKDGRILFDSEVNNNNYDLNVSNFEKGIYFVTLTTEKGEVLTSTIIKE